MSVITTTQYFYNKLFTINIQEIISKLNVIYYYKLKYSR